MYLAQIVVFCAQRIVRFILPNLSKRESLTDRIRRLGYVRAVKAER